MGFKLATDHRVRRAEARYPPVGDFVTVDGMRLHYCEQGSGTPVILIHGDGGSVYDWKMSFFDRVARDYRAIAFDQPGLGYSERPEDGASPFVQARLIHEAAEALGVEAPVVAGHSRGSNVALASGAQRNRRQIGPCVIQRTGRFFIPLLHTPTAILDPRTRRLATC